LAIATESKSGFDHTRKNQVAFCLVKKPGPAGNFLLNSSRAPSTLILISSADAAPALPEKPTQLASMIRIIVVTERILWTIFELLFDLTDYQ